MSKEISVLIRDCEAIEAKDRGLTAFSFAKERFKKEHGRDFTEEQLQDKNLFDFYISDCETAAKIVYKGDK